MYEPLYWNSKGKYQDVYERLWALVPMEGRAPTIAGEIVRLTSKLYYDRFNNGCGNFDVLSDYIAGLRYFAGVLDEPDRERALKLAEVEATDQEADEAVDVLILLADKLAK